MNKENIKVTRTLLEKKESELTPEELSLVQDYKERQKMFNERLSDANKRIVKDCKMLCSSYEHTPIPAYGWIYPVTELAYKIEEMNIRFKKYGYKIVLTQAKEKYATLRFYTDIISQPVGFLGFLYKPFNWIHEKLDSVNYGIKYVTDKEGYYSLEWNEITKDAFENKRDRFGQPVVKRFEVIERKIDADIQKARDILYFCHEGDKYYHSYILQHMPVRHAVFTKHRLLHKIYMTTGMISGWLHSLQRETTERRVIREYLFNEVHRLENEAERECMKLCQDCGIRFDDDYYEKCETQGWYTYVCERCACERGGTYRKLTEKRDMIYVEGVERPDLLPKGKNMGVCSDENAEA